MGRSKRRRWGDVVVAQQLVALTVEHTIARLLPHLANADGEVLVTPHSVKQLYPGKSWRSIDAFARRNGLDRMAIGRTPAYRKSDLDDAIATNADAQPATRRDDDDAAYLQLVKGARR